MKKLNKMAKILEGISSLIFLYPQENNRKLTLLTSSINASLKNDWEKIALDIWQSFQTIESQELKLHHGNSNDQFGKHPQQHL